MTDPKKGTGIRTRQRVQFADAARKAGEFKLSNINYQVQKLTAQHDTQQKYLVAKAIKEGKDPFLASAFNLKNAIRSGVRRINRYYGSTSHMSPHQGSKERTRRLRVGSAAYHSGIAMNELASGVTHEDE